MNVRDAGPEDIASIVDVHLRSSAAAYADFPASVLAVSREEREARWHAVIASRNSRVWVVIDAGRVFGFCHLRFPSEAAGEVATAEIASLYIAPEWWKRGLGRWLVETARAAAAASGSRALTLRVYADNRHARAAYERLGFVAAPGSSVHERSGLLLKRYTMPLTPGV